jgi:hypothetical protein
MLSLNAALLDKDSRSDQQEQSMARKIAQLSNKSDTFVK